MVLAVASDPDVEQVLDHDSTIFVSTTDMKEVEALPGDGDITNLGRLNDVRYLNKFLQVVNGKLRDDGFFIGCLQTSEQYKRLVISAHPVWLSYPRYVISFVLRRICPKLRLTRRLYFALTAGRKRLLPRAEILGRLVCCGFEIVDEREIGDEYYFVAQKARPPVVDHDPSYGPIFRMKRVGKDGKIIRVFKFRTMHPYAEYLQSYVYKRNDLDESGKLKDDFRIATWGRVMRRAWLDEVPMLLNVLSGELKLVGTRPLSEHYLSLYPPALRDRRVKYKPGLLPPYYADLPNGFDEILKSEQRYLDAYDQHPFRTDVKYLARILTNIVFKRARSG